MTNNTNKKILWVDDDINNPELLPERDELEHARIDVIPIESADKFLDKIENECDTPDCVVMDMNMGMPPINGFIVDMSMAVGKKFDVREAKMGMRTGQLLINKLLENEKYKGIPIVIYSIVAQDDGLKKFCEDNNIQYWSKSDFMPDEFAENVLEIINNPDKYSKK